MFKLSSSKLQSFIQCPLKYKYSYVDKVEGVKIHSSDREIGLLLHEVGENYHEGFDIEEVFDLYKVKYGALSNEDLKLAKSMLPTLLRYSKPFHGLQYKSECYLSYEVDEFLTLHGFIDKIYFPNTPFRGKYKAIVVDYKSGKRKYDCSTQLKFYSALIWKCFGIPPEEVFSMIFYIRLNNIKDYSFDTEDISEFIGYSSMMAEIIENNQRFGHKFSGLCNYCQFGKGICKEWEAKKKLNEIKKKNKLK